MFEALAKVAVLEPMGAITSIRRLRRLLLCPLEFDLNLLADGTSGLDQGVQLN
jgi:hypothetical protein